MERPQSPRAVLSMFPLRLCGGKPSVAVTRERRYGPSRLRVNDDDVGFICGLGKLEWLGYNLVRSHDDRLSRLGTTHQRDRQTHRQPRRHSKCRANTLLAVLIYAVSLPVYHRPLVSVQSS